MIARSSGVHARWRRRPASRAAVGGSTSTRTGVAPAAHTADAVGTAVNAGTMTSSPGPTPRAASASWSAGGTARHADRRASPVDRRRWSAGASSCSSAASSAPSRTVPESRTALGGAGERGARSGGAGASGRRGGPRAIDVVGGSCRAMPSANAMSWRPPEDPLGLGEVALEAADVDAHELLAATGRRGSPPPRPAASLGEPGDLVERQRVLVPEVEDLARPRRRSPRRGPGRRRRRRRGRSRVAACRRRTGRCPRRGGPGGRRPAGSRGPRARGAGAGRRRWSAAAR